MDLRYSLLALPLVGLLAFASGCGPGRLYKVEGVVTLDDKPLEGASVTFIPVGAGQAAAGVTGSDGFFRLTTRTTGDGAAAGDYKVTITKQEALASATSADPGNADSMKNAYKAFIKDNAKKAAVPKSQLPAMYGDASKTPLKAHVPTDGPVKFDLRSKGGG